MLWIDLDQNGKYERIGKAGAERLSSIESPGDITFDSVTLTAGQSYRMAFILGGVGGTHQWELKYKTPAMGSLGRIKPFNHHRTVCLPRPNFLTNRSEIFRPNWKPMPQV